jgi:hypothetical protein
MRTAKTIAEIPDMIGEIMSKYKTKSVPKLARLGA